jgi:hypothetical protein
MVIGNQNSHVSAPSLISYGMNASLDSGESIGSENALDHHLRGVNADIFSLRVSALLQRRRFFPDPRIGTKNRGTTRKSRQSDILKSMETAT